MEENKTELKRILSLNSLVFYGFAFMVPLTFFTTYAMVTTKTHGMVSITYIITMICMAFTAYSYANMTKAFPVAGSVYTFVHRSLNPYLGFLSGWVVLIGYMFLPMLNYLAASMLLTEAVPQVPIWVWILIFAFLVTVVNHFGIQVADIANKVIVWFQIIFIVALLIIAAKGILGGMGAGTLLDSNAFINFQELAKPEMGFGVLLGGAALLALSFLGFDAISTLSEEAINPEKNVGRAIMICCIGGGLAFAFITYILQLSWPTAWMELREPEGVGFEIIMRIAGNLLSYVFLAAYVVGCVASSISSVASASRVLYGMGRDKMLPNRIFGYLHPKYRTPTNSILIMGALGLLAIFMSLRIAASLLNFGALLAFVMVNLSVIALFYIRRKNRSFVGTVKYLICPAIGGAFTFILWVKLEPFALMLGFIWVAIGLVYLAVSTKFFKELPVEMKLD